MKTYIYHTQVGNLVIIKETQFRFRVYENLTLNYYHVGNLDEPISDLFGLLDEVYGKDS